MSNPISCAEYLETKDFNSRNIETMNTFPSIKRKIPDHIVIISH